MTTTRRSRRSSTFPLAMGVLAGALFLVSGLWAMASPRSFFRTAATFEPYNQHFLQDIGAFQIGLGAVLVLAVVLSGRNSLALALLGVGVGSGAHLTSHLLGRDLGGNPSTDIPLLAVVTVLLLAGGLVRLRTVSG